MPNVRDDLDPRLLAAAFARYQAARRVADASRALQAAKETHQREAEAHQAAVVEYENLERDIARGVRAGRQVAA